MWSESLDCPLLAQEGPEFQHYDFTLEAVIAGQRISVASWHLVPDDIRAGRLLAPLGFQESGSWYLAKRRAHPMRGLTGSVTGCASRPGKRRGRVQQPSAEGLAEGFRRRAAWRLLQASKLGMCIHSAARSPLCSNSPRAPFVAPLSF